MGQLRDRADRVKEEVRIVDLFRHFKFDILNPDEDAQVHCPFHNDVHPSAKLFVSQDTFWCWVCIKGGDVIWVVQETLGLTWPQAVDWLTETFTIPAASYEDRFRRAQTKAEVKPISLDRYWDQRHHRLVDRTSKAMAETDVRYRAAWPGFLGYVYGELDQARSDIRFGEVAGVKGVAAVFDWAHSLVDVYERRLIE
jgi:hypothetical protein